MAERERCSASSSSGVVVIGCNSLSRVDVCVQSSIRLCCVRAQTAPKQQSTLLYSRGIAAQLSKK